MALLGNTHSLNDGYLEVTVEALLYLLTRVGEVNILVERSAVIELLAQGGVGVIRRAEANRLSLRQDAIAIRGGGSTGEYIDLKFLPLFMQSFSLLCNGGRQALRVASSGKARNTHAITVVYVLSSLFCRNDEFLKWGIRDSFGQG